MTLHGDITARVIRMQPGDVLWVRLAPGVDVSDADTVRESILQVIPDECSIILTEHDIIEGIQVAPLSELLNLRIILEKAITDKLVSSTQEM